MCCVHVAQVTHTEGDGEESESHHKLIGFYEELWVDRSEQGGGPRPPQPRSAELSLCWRGLFFSRLRHVCSVLTIRDGFRVRAKNKQKLTF